MTSPRDPRDRVLVIEDDRRLRDALALALAEDGFDVTSVGDAEQGLVQFEEAAPDIVLVDIMLPGASGFELTRAVRQLSDVPLIIITARDDSHDVVAGLEAGADDYVTKPFVMQELSARIRALMRRTKAARTESPEAMTYGDLVISPAEGRVTKAGDDVALTRIEFLLLCELAQAPRRVLSRDILLANVWGYDYFGDGRVVDAHIRRLRTKIEDNPSEPIHVVTVRGLGYRFEPNADP